MPLTKAQEERLWLMAEEAGEVVQACMKILRHGYKSTHPEGGRTNLEWLRAEILDFMSVHFLMVEENDMDIHGYNELEQNIKRKLKYTHYQKES